MADANIEASPTDKSGTPPLSPVKVKKEELAYNERVQDLLDVQDDVQKELTKKTPRHGALIVLEERLDEAYRGLEDSFEEYHITVSTKGYQIVSRDHRNIRRSTRNLQAALKDKIFSITAGTEDLSKSTTNIKLPEVKLVNFTGNIVDWIPFWDSFRSLVHDNPSVSKIVKFNLLKGCLKGVAFKAIEGLQITDANYDIAIDHLKKRYVDNQRLLQRIRSDFMELKSPSHDLDQLVEFSLNIDRLLQQAINLGKPMDGDFVRDIICRKLSKQTFTQICNKYDSSNPSLLQITTGISHIIAVMENAEENTNQSVIQKKPNVSNSGNSSNTSNNNSKQKPNTVNKPESVKSSNVTSSHSAEKAVNSWNKPCVFCQELHSSKSCPKYPSFDSRVQRIRDLYLCFKCMKAGHMAANCTISPVCRNCNGSHHTFLCKKLLRNDTSVNKVTVQDQAMSVSSASVPGPEPKGSSSSAKPEVSKPEPQVVKPVQAEISFGDRFCLKPTIIPTVITQLAGNGVRMHVRTFLDTGAQRTFIHPDVVRSLNLEVRGTIDINVIPFGNEVKPMKCDVVKVTVRLGARRFPVFALVSPCVDFEVNIPGLATVVDNFKKQGIRLADPYLDSDVISRIGLSIGADYYAKFVSMVNIYSGVSVMTTPVGSVLSGTIPQWALQAHSYSDVQVQQVICRKVGTQLMDFEEGDVGLESMQNLWKLDVVGIQPETLSPEDSKTISLFDSTCSKDNSQYTVRLPFKTDARPPTNYGRALGQLKSLQKTFSSKPNLFESYQRIFSEYLALDFIEKVENPVAVEGLTHYLPHHPVYKSSVTTPIRVVFNASSKSSKNTLSLNDCLLKGPNLTSKLFDTLLDFRVHPVAAVADISKAFLRIKISELDRDYTRFLFFEDNTFKKIITYRFKVVLFGATSSPFLLQKTLNYHLESHPNPLARTLISKFYMDNLQITYACVDDLRAAYPQINSILADASMPLQGWISNDHSFNEEKNLEIEAIQNVSVLGIRWDTVSDQISLQFSKQVGMNVDADGIVTKRKVVSIISTVFDPLGLVSPVMIKAKLFIQKLWSLNLKWDEELSESLTNEFRTICSNLSHVSEFCCPRFVITPKINELHIFCDASKTAYGFAVYVTDLSGKSSHLLLSKARVSPKSILSIPKLELSAVTLATRQAKHLLHHKFEFTKCIVWTDSEVTLNWIYHNRSTQVYVRNRVSEIRQLSVEYNLQFLYVPSQLNPADILTRGSSVTKLGKNPLWKFGPSFLLNPVDYPVQRDFGNSIVVHEILTEPVIATPNVVFDFSKFSSLSRVMGIMSVIFKFCSHYAPNKFKLNPLHACVRLVQLQNFPTLYQYLTHRITQAPEEVKNLASQLDLFVNEAGLICCNSRLQNADLSDETRFPIYLPAKHHFTKLLISHYHVHHNHCSLGTLVMLIRQQFWVSKIRMIVKSVISRCVYCKRVTGKPLSQPGPPPLPEERVKYVRPFWATGVDFTGAISITNPTDISAPAEKTYVCLFTCTVTRAVHLELCNSLSSYEFLLALRRFCARFGVPAIIISDNGTNFRSAERFLVDISTEPEVVSHLQTHNITWKFITPRSPWSGGFYERLIGVTKACLCKALFRKRVNFQELHTILKEIENLINSRPLTYLSEEVREDYLTPNHLLYGRTFTLLPPLNSFEDDAPYGSVVDLRVQYARLSDVLRAFEKIWKASYLTSLKEKHLNCTTNVDMGIKVGDIVLLVTDSKRNKYPLAVIESIIPAADNVPRSVVLKTSEGNFIRPISKVIPLELSQETAPEVPPIPPPNPIPIPKPPARPKRRAAERAGEHRQKLIKYGLL